MGHRARVFEPFTTAQAARIGLTEAALRGPAVRREHHGVYVEPDVDTSVAAARLVLPADVLLDGVSALYALGVEVDTHRPLRFVTAHPHQVRRTRLLPTVAANGVRSPC